MRQPIIGNSTVGIALGTKPTSTHAGAEGVVKARRSPAFMSIVKGLDAGQVESVDVASVVDKVLSEFGPGVASPFGLLAECFLGAPYEVHILDLAGGILEHYERFAPLPEPYPRARTLAVHPSYAFVEVYRDRLVCVRDDGMTVEVR